MAARMAEFGLSLSTIFTPTCHRTGTFLRRVGSYGRHGALMRALALSMPFAFHAIVDANRAPEDADLADTLDAIAQNGRPVAVTIPMLIAAATGDFLYWLQDRKNRRAIPYRLESAGYVQVRNDAARDGLWKISGKRQVIYARNDLSAGDRLRAARQIVEGGQ
jgi:hypothetical protein